MSKFKSTKIDRKLGRSMLSFLAALAAADAFPASGGDLCPHTSYPGLIPHPLDCEEEGKMFQLTAVVV